LNLIDNINSLLGNDLKNTLKPGAKLQIAASCFSMYAYVALKKELEAIDSLEFIFTSPTFVPDQVADKLKKEQREFHIPKAERERSLYGSEFEIQLRNKLTQRAIARECADWIRRKASFRSNKAQAPMQPFAGVRATGSDTVYMPLQGFTAVANVNPAEKADLLSASISVAMNTTAFGLMVAIPLLLLHAVLQTRTTALVDSIEMASVKFLNTTRTTENA